MSKLICEHLPDDRIDVDKWRILHESQSYRSQGRREIPHFSTLMPTAHDISQNITAVAAFRWALRQFLALCSYSSGRKANLKLALVLVRRYFRRSRWHDISHD